MNIYYKIWADCITKSRSIPENKNTWKSYTFFMMSMAMAMNLVVALFIIASLKITKSIFIVPINIFPGSKIDSFISFFISYLLPFLIFNYYLVFYKNKYEKIIPKYKYYNGKLCVTYLLSSYLALPVYFFIAYLFVKVF